MTYKLPKTPMILAQGQIDFVAVGAATIPLFTTGNAPVAMTEFVWVGVDVTGFTLGWASTIGWNAPDYDNYSNNYLVNITTSGVVDVSGQPSSPSLVVPPNTTVTLKITSPDTTSTTDVQQYFITGLELL